MMDKAMLKDVNWSSMKVKDLFTTIYRGKRHIEKNREKGDIQYYSASSVNNGVTDFISNPLFTDRDKLLVTTFCDSYFAEGKFTASDEITILGNENLTKESGLFLASLIKSNADKYAFGRKAFAERIKEQIIIIPVTDSGNPNWHFMGEYIKQEQKQVAQQIIDYYEQKMLETAFDLVGLEEVEWKEFPFNKIFRKIQRGKRLKKADHIEGDTPYVSSTAMNNGVDGFIGNKDGVRKFSNNLTLANSGSVGSCFYHEYEYIASDHVTSLSINGADKNIYLFMSTIVRRLEEKYSFNREINDKRIKQEKIILPVDKNGNPHWEYMSKFVEKLESEKVQEVLEYIYIYRLAKFREGLIAPINLKSWSEFWLEDIVTISSGVRLTKANQEKGNRAFIGSSDSNNGVTEFVSNTNNSLDKNVLGINYNGSVVENFYHPYKAIFSDDVKRIHWIDEKQEDRYTYLFLKQAILQQKVKYAYGYKFNAGRMKRQKIMLPIKDDGTPDYAYMREYIQIEEIKQSYEILKYYREYR